MQDEGDEKRPTPLGLGQSLGGIHNGTRRQHSATATAQLYTNPPLLTGFVYSYHISMAQMAARF